MSEYLAFDLGAESGRAVLGRYDGSTLALEEIRRFPNRPVRLPDGLYWDALGLYGELVDTLRDVSPRSVGIDSWGVDFGLLDATGTLTAPPLHHRDGRGAAVVETAFARVPAERIYERTGIQVLPFNTAFQLLALEGTPALERAERMLLIPDLLSYWLTGERVAEATNASTTQLLDVRTGGWASDLIGELQLPERLFAPVVEAGTLLAPGVVAVASHDTASAVVAVPFEPGARAAYISSGTWSLVGVELDAPNVSAKARAANLTNERGFGGTIRLLKNVMGLWLVQECRRAWPDWHAPSYRDLAELAASAAPGGPLFDPDAPELLAPGGMPERIRALCPGIGGGRAELLRAIFESLACKYRVVLDELEAVTGTGIDIVHVVGGGAQNTFLCELTAAVTGRVVLAGPVEATAMGNLLVQLNAFGELGSLAEMREVVRRSAELVSYEPDRALGEELFDRYLHRSLEVAR
jgi:rhamnulokinase